MDTATVLQLAQVLLRILIAAPLLITAVEQFWMTVTGNPGAPPHVEAAMQAAFTHVKLTGEVGDHHTVAENPPTA